MSKKRERAETNLDGDSDGVGDTTIDDGAESLLFEIAAPSLDDTSGSSSSSKKKRSKSSATKPRSAPSQDSNGNNNGDDDDDAAAVGAREAGSAAAAASAKLQYHTAAIAPSSVLRQCDGFDVVRKGARGRGRQLMVLPGTLGLGNGGSGGKLGALNNATSARPVLYVEFPEVGTTAVQSLCRLPLCSCDPYTL